MAAATEPSERLAHNLLAVQARLSAAARAAGRDSATVRLCAVTKSAPASLGLDLVGLGVRDLAENRLSGLEAQRAALEESGADARLHFIGHLQRNKARRVVGLCDVLHSVDSLRLAESLARLTADRSRPLEIYLQLALSGEPQKHGLTELELAPALDIVRGAPGLSLAGLMAMGPREERPGHSSRDVFARAAALASALERMDATAFVRSACELSLGMSADLEEAVAAGSTLVRVGSALFEGLDLTGANA